MKISFFTQNIAPFRMEWMDALAEYYDVTIYHVNEYVGEVNKQFISYKNKKAIVKDVGKKIGGRKIYDLKKILADKHEFILLDGYGFFAQQILIIYLSFHNIKFVMTIDGGFINSKESIFKKCLKSFFLNKASCFFSTSKETDDFIDFYCEGKARIFRHKFSSIYLEDIVSKSEMERKQQYRRELDIKNVYTIISVGKFIPVKGFDIIIQALSHCNKEVQLYIIGGNNEEIYKKYINDDIKDKVFFVDFCDKELLKKYYLASDVYVMASRGDVWGLVVGEAMACGLPIITSDKCLAGLALIKDGENGCIFPSGDYLKLAECIDFFDKDIMQRYGKRNLEKIREYAIEEAVKEDKMNIDWIAKNM